MTRPSRLTPKQAKFVEEYLVDLNATAAARRAGYSVKTAEQQGPRLLGNVGVATAIQAALQRRAKRTAVTQDRVLAELARVAFSDIRSHFNGEDLRALSELSDDAAAAVSSVEVVLRRRPGDERIVERLHKIRLWDKVSALEKLAKHLGMLKETVRLEGTIPPFILKMEE